MRITIRDASEATGIHLKQLQNWVATNKVTSYQHRPGGPREIDADSLRDYLLKNRDHWGERVEGLDRLLAALAKK